jgi:hypothetical protein
LVPAPAHSTYFERPDYFNRVVFEFIQGAEKKRA